MSSEFVGFRLNHKHDKDILDAISNAKDRTKEIKRLIRLGLQTNRTQVTIPEGAIDIQALLPLLQLSQKVHPMNPESHVSEKKEAKAIDWRPTFEKQEENRVDKKTVAANILGGFD